MNKGLKIVFWIIAIIFILAIIGFIVWKVWLDKKISQIWDNITFSKPVPQSLDLNGVTLADLQNILTTGQSKTITLTLAMNIENKNNFSIPFSARIKSSYKGAPIAETDTISGTIPANGTFPFSSAVTVTLSGAQLQILIQKIQGKKVSIDYSVDLSLYGIPLSWFGYTFTDTYQI